MSKKEKAVSDEIIVDETKKPKKEKKAKKQSKLGKIIKGLKTSTKIIFALAVVIVLIVAGWLISITGEEGKLTTISESSLQKIIEINELSTVDYTYNATVSKTKPDSTEIMYHVAYEGTVTAGIDFHEIAFDLNEEEKIVTITIPEVEIHNISVNMGTMDYIFTKDKYDTETISQEAYKLCKADLKKRIEDEELLKKTAKENAISSVEALFKPWIETVDKEYQVVIK